MAAEDAVVETVEVEAEAEHLAMLSRRVTVIVAHHVASPTVAEVEAEADMVVIVEVTAEAVILAVEATAIAAVTVEDAVEVEEAEAEFAMQINAENAPVEIAADSAILVRFHAESEE